MTKDAMVRDCGLIIGCVLALSIVTQQTQGQENSKTPQRLRPVLNEALTAIGAEFKETELIQIAEAQTNLNKSLDSLAGLVDEQVIQQAKSDESENIESKIVLLAVDRRQHPQRYQEIDHIYFHPTTISMAPHVLTAPVVRSEHATEAYRLVWEYFLLTRPVDAIFKADLRATEALARIHNDASVLTFVYCYKMTTQADVPSRRFSTLQGWLFASLAEFRSSKGLSALLECASLSESQRSREISHESSFDSEQELTRLLRGSFGHKEEWRKLVDAFPKGNLPPEQKALLQKATQAL